MRGGVYGALGPLGCGEAGLWFLHGDSLSWSLSLCRGGVLSSVGRTPARGSLSVSAEKLGLSRAHASRLPSGNSFCVFISATGQMVGYEGCSKVKCCMGNDDAGEGVPRWGESVRDPLSANGGVASYVAPFTMRQWF